MAIIESASSRWLGPLASVVGVTAILVLRSFVPVPSPELILLALVALSAILGGIRTALVSAAIVVVFVAVDASLAGHLFQYDSPALSRIVVNAATAFVMALLVGGMRRRLEAMRELLPAQPNEDRPHLPGDPASAAVIASTVDGAVLAAKPVPGERFGVSMKLGLPQTDDAAVAERQAPLAALPPTSRHKTILVAEDEAFVRDMVVAALERLGYRVIAASTGEEAVRLIDRLGEEIDLLLSDVVMPGMSGPDLLDRARRTRPELRAIFMSGYTALTMGRPIQAGVTLLQKPFSDARLGGLVRETLASE